MFPDRRGAVALGAQQEGGDPDFWKLSLALGAGVGALNEEGSKAGCWVVAIADAAHPMATLGGCPRQQADCPR